MVKTIFDYKTILGSLGLKDNALLILLLGPLFEVISLSRTLFYYLRPALYKYLSLLGISG